MWAFTAVLEKGVLPRMGSRRCVFVRSQLHVDFLAQALVDPAVGSIHIDRKVQLVAYLRRAGVPTSPDDLRTHRCAGVRFTSGQAFVWRFAPPRGQPIEISPQPALTTNDPESLIDLALADAGIVQAVLHHALPHLRRGSLKLLLPGLHDPGRRETVVHYPHRQYLAPRVRVVVDALLARLGGEPDLQLTVAQALAANPEWVAAAAPTGRRSTAGKR